MARHLARTRASARWRIAGVASLAALVVGYAAIGQTQQSDRDLLISIHQQLHAAGIPDTQTTSSTTAPTTSSTSTSTSTTAVPTTSTTAVPTTTSTTQPPTTSTSTTAPPTTTTTAPSGSYGTSGYGPGREPCTTTGTVVTSTAAVTSAPANSTILIRGGIYLSGFTAPTGSTVKPYNCETVQINDNINVNNNVVIAGLGITANSDGWALRVTARTNVEIRNSIIRGGTTEAIRVDGAANNIRFLNNHIDGGVNNHTMKVRSASGSPTNVLIENNLFTKIHFGGGEDLLQLEGHGVVIVRRNTFRDNPSGEDGVDVKNGNGATFTGNLFHGPSINFECLLVQGDLQPILVEANQFDDCTTSLGAHPEGNHNPSWTFRGNLLIDSTLRLRRSFDPRMENNVWQNGGRVQLGTSTSGDYPRNAIFTGNNFGSATWSAVSGSTFSCNGTNSGTGQAGSACN